MGERCGHCTHYSHGECWEAAMVMVREADSERVDTITKLDAAENEIARLQEVAEAARNVVAQWRGDISRKPHIGRLREALAKLGNAG